MKKKIIIPIVILIFLILGIVCFLLFSKKTASIITLDINPSIEIHLTKNEKVKDVIALNEDAKDVVDSHLRGKSLDDAFQLIIQKMVEKEYIDTYEPAHIILYSNGELPSKVVLEKLNNAFMEQDLNYEVVVIDSISKEDKELAKKYHITEAKAAYIHAILKENDGIDVKYLVDQSVKDLREAMITGKYCDSGYAQEGDWCLKEIDRVPASDGEVCPREYLEYNGVCYGEKPFDETDKLVCSDGFTLEGNQCVKRIVENATPDYHCEVGELYRKGDLYTVYDGDREQMVCADKSTGQAPKLRCLYNSGHIIIDGKCYNGPAPLINGGCPNGDLPRGGGCYSLDDEDQWQCPDGGIYHRSQNSVPDVCPDTITYYEPTVTGYSCPDDYTIEGTQCIKRETYDATKERICPADYTMIEFDRCINYNQTANKEKGFVCNQENARLKGNTCIIYEMKEAYESK